jgi:antagonist of KipI
MAIRIHKAGLLDTIQDAGRYGYQYLGINPGGAMDITAMKLANALVGNDPNEAVLEMHFPAAEMMFEEMALIALAGADFAVEINGELLPILHPVIIQKNTVLKFRKQQKGARVYMAVKGGYQTNTWLGSNSTNSKVQAGGFEGRALQKNDKLLFKQVFAYSFQKTETMFAILPWSINLGGFYPEDKIRFIPGAEYHELAKPSQQKLETASFSILPQSDRMGFRLKGDILSLTSHKEMISTAVPRGTMQLLPDGQLIILMAEHQTTGGYPRIGHVITAGFAALAQMRTGERISFQKTELKEAETLLLVQERNLQQLQNACNFRLNEYLNSQK